MKKKDIRIGDWVRFWQNGRLVIGIVQYEAREGVTGDLSWATDAGVAEEDLIEEVRSKD